MQTLLEIWAGFNLPGIGEPFQFYLPGVGKPIFSTQPLYKGGTQLNQA
jgi:hypothetical protein